MHHRTRLYALSLLSAFLLAGCASASGGGASTSGTVLTREDLAQSDHDNLYDVLKYHYALEEVRPGGNPFLSLSTRSDGVDSSTGERLPVLLVLDGARMTAGGHDALTDLRPDAVQRVQILRPSEAGVEYGTGRHSGVVVVETRR